MGKRKTERGFFGERERGGKEKEGVFESFLFIGVVVTICKEEKRICRRERETERQTERKKEMFSLERALIGFAAAVGDSVSRRPAMHVVGSLVAFGLLAVGILLVEVESDVFKLWVRTTYYVGRDIVFFLSSFEDDDDVCSLSSRLVEYHHHHHHHLCVCVSARGSVVRCDSKARRRQTDRARATLFFGRSRSSFFFFC